MQRLRRGADDRTSRRRQSPHRLVDVEVLQAELFTQIGTRGSYPIVSNETFRAEARLVPEEDLPGNLEVRYVRLILVDAEDAGDGRLVAISELYVATVAKYLALVGPLDAGQDPDEGGLAGTILARDSGYVASM